MIFVKLMKYLAISTRRDRQHSLCTTKSRPWTHAVSSYKL